MEGHRWSGWASSESVGETFWEGLSSWILKEEKMWGEEQGDGPSKRGATGAEASRRDLGKTLKDKEGLNRLRRERKAVEKEHIGEDGGIRLPHPTSSHSCPTFCK